MEKKTYNANKTRASKAGLEPGILMPTGSKVQENPFIIITGYSKENYFTNRFLLENFNIEKLPKHTDCLWMHICGLHNVHTLQAIGKYFSIDSLIMEDIVNSDQRPKFEEFEDGVLLILKYIFKNKSTKFITEQCSLVLKNNVLISFSEHYPDFLEKIIIKLENTNSKLRSKKIDFLAYTLLDNMVDQFFYLVEEANDTIEKLEEKVIRLPDSTTLPNIQAVKKDILNLKKVSYPLREAIVSLEKSKTPFFEKETYRYIKDVKDHIFYVSESADNMKDSLHSIMELYLSNVNRKTNEVVKVLTLLSAIFIPLTFLVGVYGMNFKYMPELEWKNGYYFSWILMLCIAICMLMLFKIKRWF